MSNAKSVFLDRDGVLNELIYYADTGENESPRIADDMQIFPNVGKHLRRLHDAGWGLFLVTNQPSYAKGKTSLENLQSVHRVLVDYLELEGIPFQNYYYCYCHPASIIPEYGEPCDCRKPKPGMLLKAQATYGIPLEACWIVGDSDADVLCGQAVGTRTILIDYPLSSEKRTSSCTPDYQCNNLAEAVDIILEETTHETG